MNIHQNARLTVHGRELIVKRVLSGQAPKEVAVSAGVCPRTVRKWVRRFEAEGPVGLRDRSSRPRRLRAATPPEVVDRIARLRRQRWTGARIAAETGVSPATVSRILKTLGLSRLGALDAEPVRRYERKRPGEMIHLDIKKLGRIGGIGHRITGRQTGVVNRHQGIGWEYVHVCIDDASRLAFSQVHRDQTAGSAIAHLDAAVAWYARLGVRVERVMTDNGSCYRSHAFARACRRLGLKHIFTRPYRPQTNGKAERFIQTALREWAYAAAYPSSEKRTDALSRWLHQYNWHRPHSAIGAKAPINRLGLSKDNLLRFHT